MTTKTSEKQGRPADGAAGKPGKSGRTEFTAQWTEARRAYPVYAALAARFQICALPYPEGHLPPPQPTLDEFEHLLAWMDEIDGQVQAFQLRQLLPVPLNASEEMLRAFTQRHLRKSEKSDTGRDIIDFLLVQYFALCAPENLYHQEIALADVASVLQPVLIEADATPLEWCQPLDGILAKLEECGSLGDLMEEGLLEQGRLLKESAGAMFYDPAALVAFVRFNFVLRRTFIRLLHSDLRAIREAVETLSRAGIRAADCRRAGFSAAEPILKLRTFCDEWRQPFHKDYSSSSVKRVFEQLIALRTDLEEAVVRLYAPPEKPVRISPPAAAKPAPPAPPAKPAAPRAPTVAAAPAKPVVKPPAARQVAPPPNSQPAARPAPGSKAVSAKPPAPKPPVVRTPAPPVETSPATQADVEGCLEKIWEQLIDQPPSRGRSMSTVVLEDTKVLLSSWEVGAFVSDGGQESEDLRRAVVARALLATAMDARKRSGESAALEAALGHARSEVTYFQGRVEQAKRAKNTEAAVNLGISAKRLLSFMEEAEKIQE